MMIQIRIQILKRKVSSCVQDASELEEAVVAHLAQPQAIGRPFRSLRAFKPLLFAGTLPRLIQHMPPSIKID
jgi:hypothetical protein